jgi:integrase/recombinase XerC
MGKVTQKALLTYLMVREDHYKELWVTEERKPLSLRGLQIAIKRLCSYAEVKSSKQGPHIFRHTAAITYLRNGGDVFTLQTMLGHSTLEMTRKYVSSLGTDDMIKAHKKASPADNLKF